MKTISKRILIQKSDEPESPRWKTLLVVFLGFFLYSGLAFWFWWIVSGQMDSVKPDKKTGASLRDFAEPFSIFSAYFTGLGVFGLAYTIWLQQHELKLQRQELSLTRAQLKESTEAQKLSEVALKGQLKTMALGAKLDALQILLKAQYDILSPSLGSPHTLSNQDLKDRYNSLSNVGRSTVNEIVELRRRISEICTQISFLT